MTVIIDCTQIVQLLPIATFAILPIPFKLTTTLGFFLEDSFDVVMVKTRARQTICPSPIDPLSDGLSMACRYVCLCVCWLFSAST